MQVDCVAQPLSIQTNRTAVFALFPFLIGCLCVVRGAIMDIKLANVGHMQQAQAAPEQAEKLPSYSERYYDDYFEYRYGSRSACPIARSPLHFVARRWH